MAHARLAQVQYDAGPVWRISLWRSSSMTHFSMAHSTMTQVQYCAFQYGAFQCAAVPDLTSVSWFRRHVRMAYAFCLDKNVYINALQIEHSECDNVRCIIAPQP